MDSVINIGYVTSNRSYDITAPFIPASITSPTSLKELVTWIYQNPKLQELNITSEVPTLQHTELKQEEIIQVILNELNQKFPEHQHQNSNIAYSSGEVNEVITRGTDYLISHLKNETIFQTRKIDENYIYSIKLLINVQTSNGKIIWIYFLNHSTTFYNIFGRKHCIQRE